jgi:HD superfamily phosphohydrolase
MNKVIFDPIHGHINLDPLAIKIIDTPIFQRLRNIKQLSTVSYVFPSANHTRFEHSIGVYYLADLFINTLKKNQPELNITDNMISNIRIAGLCHDLGHGPFSHLFDKVLEKHLPENKMYLSRHETRSILLLKKIVKKYNLRISEEDLDIISKIIDPGPNDIGYIYQIVANKHTGLDVDKFDYLKRDSYFLGLEHSCDYLRLINNAKVIDNQISFPYKLVFNIYDIFLSRAKLHNQVYTHNTCRSIEYMVMDILKDHKDLIENFNLNKFCEYNDHDLLTHDKNNFILKCIHNRDLYQKIYQFRNLDNNKLSLLENLQKEYPDLIIDNYEIGISESNLKNINYSDKNTENHILLNIGIDRFTRIFVKTKIILCKYGCNLFMELYIKILLIKYGFNYYPTPNNSWLTITLPNYRTEPHAPHHCYSHIKFIEGSRMRGWGKPYSYYLKCPDGNPTFIGEKLMWEPKNPDIIKFKEVTESNLEEVLLQVKDVIEQNFTAY